MGLVANLIAYIALLLAQSPADHYEEPTAVPPAAPTEAVVPAPTVEPVAVQPALPVGDPRSEFIRGYRDASGPEGLLDHFLNVVIPCESGWQPDAVSPYGHLGLAQFAEASWYGAGGGDWTDPYQQGVNVARWVGMTDPPTQWACW